MADDDGLKAKWKCCSVFGLEVFDAEAMHVFVL